MPYLNEQVYSPSDLGLSAGDYWGKITGAAKSGSDLYQLTQQQKAMRSASSQSALQQQAPIAEEKSFLEKHGLKLALAGGGLVVLLLVLKMKKG